MKKFAFDLQGILNIKEKLEGQAKINFGIAMARLNAEEEKRDAILSKLNEYRDNLTVLMSGPLDLLRINRCEDAIDIYKDKLANQELMVKRASKQVELARAKLNAVMTERKTIEKLREKRFNEYINEINAEERKEIDELTSYRHSVSDEDIVQLGEDYGEE